MLDERYKVKYGAVQERLGTQKVLLPLSFGTSSLVLFDMVASLLQEQNLAHLGKQGFELVVLHLKEKDDEHTSFDTLAAKYQPVKIQFVVMDVDTVTVGERKQISVNSDFDVLAQSLLQSDAESKSTVSELLAKTPNRSLRADLLAQIYEDLIFQTAKAHQCQTILFGHSMTRLASEVIDLTVKGRGLVIYSHIRDGPRQYNGQTVHVIFPFRDILYAEVEAVLRLLDGLDSFVHDLEPQTQVVKNMTVHALTTQYFAHLDATGYSSTASTVVKTAAKLGGPKEAPIGECQVCGADIHQDPHRWLRNITVSSAAPLNTDEEREYSRMYEASHAEVDETGLHLTVCYGCTVTLAGAGSGFVWPVRQLTQDVLDEFVLTDEE